MSMKEDMLAQETDIVEEQEGTASDQSAIESLTAERDQLIDQLQRSVAEFQNYRRRNEQDRFKMREIATRDVLLSILPPIDDLDRAIRNIPDEEQMNSLREGLLAIERKFLNVLERNGVTQVGSAGDEFDPAFHEAVATDESGERSHVVEVYQTGYRQGDASLRPAMVKVGGKPTFQA
ncbi:MAG TPA: nucleotide exchange factor GrpE [Thermomicrobiales bacterium]|jgi:molecular chaperone GrpE|nr:nucleotide exchange factor GrpE [Thermomicrobiales bacterium]